MPSKTKSLSAAIEIFDQEIEGVIRKIPLRSIQPSKSQPRQNKEVNIDTLARSLDNDGLLQPILVTGNRGSYTIIAGERRYRAALALSWSDIECRILDKSEQETYKLAVIENIQRENLDPLEESLAYKKLKQQFNYSDSELSGVIGKSRNYISEIISIAEVPHPLLEKASKEGMASKNILIQLAQASKKGLGDDFIHKFKSGEASTVKAAKKYLRETTVQDKNKRPLKPEQKIPSYESPLGNRVLGSTRESELFIHIEKNYSKSTLDITINTPLLQLEKISIKILEKALRDTMSAIMNNQR